MGPRNVALLALLAVLVGCGSDDAGSDRPEAPAAQETSGTERCGSAVAAGSDLRLVDLEVGGGSTIRAAAFGPEDAERVVVLLHQVGPFGWCGWARWAEQAAREGVASLAVDLCGYADSTCADALTDDTSAQVDGILDALGTAFPVATETVLAGSSMGGHLAVEAVADGAGVVAWADVSGPEHWGGGRLADRAAEVAARDLPGLVLSNRTEPPGEYVAARDLARASGARFVDSGSGHGYETLTRLDGGLSRTGRVLVDLVLPDAP